MGRRAVLITGASTGIGRACALYLEALGFQVFAGVRREQDGATLRQATERLVPLLLDVTDASSIAAATDRVAAAVGNAGLAGLVNNAGIAVVGPLEFLPLAEFRRQLEVNVTGQLAVTQACLPLLRQGRGRVVNMGSIGGRLATPLLGPYSASKFALEALTDALRQELLPWGLQVSIVEPGAVVTPIWGKSLAAALAMAADLPPQAGERYGALIERVQGAAWRSERSGMPAISVARAVAHALTAARPRTRYLVGNDACLQALLARLVPDRLRDRLILRALGLIGTERGDGLRAAESRR